MKRRLEQRPTSGQLIVPYMVDERSSPIDFKNVHHGHVRKCMQDRLCGICGRRISNSGPIAFVGPDDGRRCFSDPWMHVDCARLAMEQCPFLAGRRDWREVTDQERQVLLPYAHNMVLFIANQGRSHRDVFGAYHFEALGDLRRG